MTNQEAQNLAENLYNNIFSSLTASPDGGKGAYDPNKILLTMLKPGAILNMNDFSNPWTPGNPNGNQEHALNLWDLINHAPTFNAVQGSLLGGEMISQFYSDILKSTVTAVDQPNPTLKKQYDDAFNFLHVKAKDENGNDTVVQAPIWATYDANYAAYVQAQAAYQSAYQAAISDPTTKAQWPIVAPTLQLPVKQAFTKWRAEGADQVEAKLAILQTSGGNQIQRAFADAQLLYNGYTKDLDGSGAMLPRSAVAPSNWYMSDAVWGQMKWSHATQISKQSSDFKSYGGGAGFSLGLWSVGGGAQHTSSNFQSDASYNSVQVSYKYMVLQARRPWIANILALPNWKTAQYPKGKLSSGSKNNQQASRFPVLPTAYILIKDLEIKADFSSSELDRASSSTTAKASVGWGPFSVSGNYTSRHSSEYAKGEVAAGSIKQKGMQVIGMISNINPQMPPQ